MGSKMENVVLGCFKKIKIGKDTTKTRGTQLGNSSDHDSGIPDNSENNTEPAKQLETHIALKTHISKQKYVYFYRMVVIKNSRSHKFHEINTIRNCLGGNRPY